MSDYEKVFKSKVYPENTEHDKRYDINVDKSSSNTIPAVLVVDSSQRNRSVYENPGKYSFQFIKQYRDVISLELIQANIPNSFYSINNNNNKITINVGTNQHIISIPLGNYNDVDNLTTLINTRINNVVPGAWTFSVDKRLNKFKLDGPTGFTVVSGAPQNADIIVGIGSLDLVSNANSVTMPNCYVMHPYRYLILEIRNMQRCDGNTSALMDSFCIIPIDTAADNSGILKNGDTIDNDTYVFYFPEPLHKLADMEITFRTPDGNICDFNGRDHFLVFEIRSLSRPHKR